MTCRQLKFDVIDVARGAALDPAREAAVESHLRSCPSCRALVDRQRAMSAALRRLATDPKVPAFNPGRLNNLLAAVGRPRRRSRRATVAVGLSLAASVLIVASLSVGLQREATAPGSPQVVAATLAPPMGAETAFVVLPGADALPRLESGRVIRIEIPESELTAVGLWQPGHAGAVLADVLVGQDGLARAVRLVQ
jgi:predicted anti-sigma-YlaC factor YlaD